MSKPDSGAYCLLVHLAHDVVVAVGRLGRFQFAAGYYVYTGSAMRGLAARLTRHQRRDKTLRWHIDYLLAASGARVVECVAYPSPERQECTLNQAVQRKRGARVPIKGFGSSDCQSGCPAHLTYFKLRPRLPSGVRR